MARNSGHLDMMVSLENIWKVRAYVPPFENLLLDLGKSSDDLDEAAESQPHCFESALSPIANLHHVLH